MATCSWRTWTTMKRGSRRTTKGSSPIGPSASTRVTLTEMARTRSSDFATGACGVGLTMGCSNTHSTTGCWTSVATGSCRETRVRWTWRLGTTTQTERRTSWCCSKTGSCGCCTAPRRRASWWTIPMRLRSALHPTGSQPATWIGDSPSAHLVDGPFLVKGRLAPTVVLTLPPYIDGLSNGTSSATYGDTQTVGETLTDTVSLKASIALGVGADFPGGFKASMTETLSTSVSLSQATNLSRSIGSRFSVSANPELYGDRYGAVALSWGCYHGYKYEVHDPAGVLGGDGGAVRHCGSGWWRHFAVVDITLQRDG